MSPTPEVVTRAIRAYFDAINRLDVDAWVAAFAPDGTSEDPMATVSGHEGLRQFFAGIAGLFERVQFIPEAPFVVGGRAAVEFSGRFTGKNGRQATAEGIDVFEVDERGKVRRVTGYWDPVALIAAIQGAPASAPSA